MKSKSQTININLDLQSQFSYNVYSPWHSVLQQSMNQNPAPYKSIRIKCRSLMKCSSLNHSFNLKTQPPRRTHQRRHSFSDGLPSKKIVRIDSQYPYTVVSHLKKMTTIKSQRRKALQGKLKTFFRKQLLLHLTARFWQDRSLRAGSRSGSQLISNRSKRLIQPPSRAIENKIKTTHDIQMNTTQKLQKIIELRHQRNHSQQQSVGTLKELNLLLKVDKQQSPILRQNMFNFTQLNKQLLQYTTKKLENQIPYFQKQSIYSKKLPTVTTSSLYQSQQSSVYNIYLSPTNTSTKTCGTPLKNKLIRQFD